MRDHGSLDGDAAVTATLNDWTSRFDQLRSKASAGPLSAEELDDLARSVVHRAQRGVRARGMPPAWALTRRMS